MNAENLRRVADAIEKHEIEWLGFNMHDWVAQDVTDMSGHGCMTTACNAGWAIAVLDDKKSFKELDQVTIPVRAQKLLDLTLEESDALFYDRPAGMASFQVTPQMAVRTLRYAADHGVVDWDAANP